MDIMSLAKRVSEQRAKLGLSQEQLSVMAGVSQQAVCSIESGETKSPRGATLIGIADALKVTVNWLCLGGNKDRVDIDRPQQFLALPVAQPSELKQTLPVYGSAQGGNGDGWFEMNGTPIDHVKCPTGLQNVKGAYALRVQGISMEPRYFEGELIYVNPSKTVTPGCFVVIQIRPIQSGDPVKAYVKQLVRRTAEKLVVHQYQPECDYDIPADTVLSVHRIMNGEELF